MKSKKCQMLSNQLCVLVKCEVLLQPEKDQCLFRQRWRRCWRLFNLTVWSQGRLNIKYTEILPTSPEILRPFFIFNKVFFIIQKFQLLMTLRGIIYTTKPSFQNLKLTVDCWYWKYPRCRQGLLMQIRIYWRKILENRIKFLIFIFLKHQ